MPFAVDWKQGRRDNALVAWLGMLAKRARQAPAREQRAGRGE